jgi:hypothetical protein
MNNKEGGAGGAPRIEPLCLPYVVVRTVTIVVLPVFLLFMAK